MKVEQIYREAAALICDYTCTGGLHHPAGCMAIQQVAEQNRCYPYPRWLAKTGFRIVFGNSRMFWFGYPRVSITIFLKTEFTRLERMREHRVFALLFMAELAKDAGI